MTADADDKGAPPCVVFCGGCNPHIDRGAVAAELAGGPSGGAAGGGADAELADEEIGAGTGATVYLNGCPRACASDHRLTSDEPGDVVVAGETVDGRPTPRQDIADAVRQKLKE